MVGIKDPFIVHIKRKFICMGKSGRKNAVISHGILNDQSTIKCCLVLEKMQGKKNRKFLSQVLLTLYI